ncbi:MAG: DegT/DnrJ/EryC1/StrS family aminotransferase [Verrucomicrobia bacterium]|nr:DegT/DnrJ/EryC1/StrS family aminotransferase [Verrucomicrobiota bacterium]
MNRRRFLETTAASSAALTWLSAHTGPNVFAADAAKPALLGGAPAHKGGWAAWPEWREEWEPKMLEVYRSRKWFRLSGPHVPEFEKAWAEMLGAKKALAVASGTTSLIVGLHVMDVGPGDEVIVSPYTFIATYNAILANSALPVFADTDPATLTMCPKSIESRITERTRAIMPVHIYGMPCDMDQINPIAKKHKLAVVEDACQAWLAEYKGRKCGTLGDVGGFSFQESKHIPSGEGGAITSMSEDVIDRCNAYHNCGRSCGNFKGTGSFTPGMNYRMTQFQAALLLQQFDKLKKQTAIRRANADHLSANLGKIPGITPIRLPENSRPAWHLYPFIYNAEQFNGLSRDKFMAALRAEGVPCSSPYREQYYDGLLDVAINSRGYKRLWSADRLKAYRESFKDLKGNKQACETMVAISQNMLLADRSDIDQILEAIRKIQAHSAALLKKA